MAILSVASVESARSLPTICGVQDPADMSKSIRRIWIGVTGEGIFSRLRNEVERVSRLGPE